ncbi:serine hydrolase domain-containing protein [Pseudoalteromonas sp. R3]|uniref:serine hydrolase domain-containing protein n=1 Tax=Pseudoalteromonas sp. R3 TaxID=1709477 RepID=UPI0006B435A8|nr:serine hydrolase domain-containing protein [Pseudoalteromonas sp. R3]AZZ99143.1 class A beta-lactamase-related serine hydrolase [Pseudoalteromonas sp. R3]
MYQRYQPRLRVILLCCSCVFLSACFKESVAQDHTIGPKKVGLFKQILADYCDTSFFGTVYVTSGDDVVYEANCGPRNLSSYTHFMRIAKQHKFDPDTLDPEYQVGLNTSDSKYRIGSNTKEFAAALLQKALRQEEIETKTIGDYLSWFPNNECKDITLHNLLTMSSGIDNYSNNPEVYLNWGWRPFLDEPGLNLNGPEAFSYRFCTCQKQGGAPSFTPGSKFEYSNCNYYLIGNIIEQLNAGKQGDIPSEFYFGNILKQDILSELKMHDSGTFNAIGVYENMTTGYVDKDNLLLSDTTGRLPETGVSDCQAITGLPDCADILESPYSNPMVLYSAGNMYSTVKDMHLWDKGLYGDSILNDEQKKRAFTPYQKAGNEAQDDKECQAEKTHNKVQRGKKPRGKKNDRAFQCEYFGYGWFVNYVPKHHRKKIHCPDKPSSSNIMNKKKYEKFVSYSGNYPYSWVTSFSRLLERNQAVMVFSNYNKAGYETDCIAQEIRNVIFYNKAYRSKHCKDVLIGAEQKQLFEWY